MRDRVYLRIFTKLAKRSKKNFHRNWLPLAFIFTIVISFPWKSFGVECSKSDKLGKINNTISVRVGEMTVLSNELSVRFPNGDAEPKLNGTNSTLDLALTTKRSLVGHSETPKPSTKPKISTTESIAEAELKTIEDEDTNSLENELDDSPVKSSKIVDVPEVNEVISSELDIEVPANDDDTDPTLSVSIENEFYAEDTEDDDDDGLLRSSVTPKYKTTSVVTSPPFSALDSEESNESPETINDIVFFSSTPRSLGEVTYIKKIPTRLLAAASTRIKQKQKLDSATKRSKLITPRPRKKIVISTPKPRRRKRPVKVTKAPKPTTTTPKTVHYERNPHHPHGVVVFDRRKKRPKPTRRMTTTTTTTTEEPTVVDLDYYDYYLSSGENSVEFTGSNPNNSIKTISRIPLSKLALAMLASSAGFDNGTDDLVYFPKTPINLLNILQAYTKQLQVASTETFKPPLKIERQPFMVHLNGLNFAAKIGISVYYSLIAIIPLVYLAFGGLGRLGLSAFVGRNLALLGRGKKRRRKRRSFDEHYYHYYGGYNNHFNRGTLQANKIKRIHLKDQDLEDEYSWILGRISEVIWELSQVPYELNHPQV